MTSAARTSKNKKNPSSYPRKPHVRPAEVANWLAAEGDRYHATPGQPRNGGPPSLSGALMERFGVSIATAKRFMRAHRQRQAAIDAAALKVQNPMALAIMRSMVRNMVGQTAPDTNNKSTNPPPRRAQVPPSIIECLALILENVTDPKHLDRLHLALARQQPTPAKPCAVAVSPEIDLLTAIEEFEVTASHIPPSLSMLIDKLRATLKPVPHQ